MSEAFKQPPTWLEEAAQAASNAYGEDGSWRDVVRAVDALVGERDMRIEIPETQAAPVSPDLACRVCNGGGMLTVPDSDGESASEQACPDPVHDGTSTAEPEAAKVIIVERDGHPARRFAASTWEVLSGGPEHGDLVLRDAADDTVVQLGARTWDAVYDSATVDGDPYYRQGKKLAIALDALRKIDQDGDDYSARATAEEALANIADVDL
jgi:hypothetical protein